MQGLPFWRLPTILGVQGAQMSPSTSHPRMLPHALPAGHLKTPVRTKASKGQAWAQVPGNPEGAGHPPRKEEPGNASLPGPLG